MAATAADGRQQQRPPGLLREDAAGDGRPSGAVHVPPGGASTSAAPASVPAAAAGAGAGDAYDGLTFVSVRESRAGGGGLVCEAGRGRLKRSQLANRTAVVNAHQTQPQQQPQQQHKRKQHMIAGSVAGVVEHTAMYPVDTVKTRMQALSHPGQRVSRER